MLIFNSSSSPRRSSKSGFTLIELLVVVAIIAVLAALLIPALGAARRSAKKSAALAGLNALQTALSSYSSDFQGAYPLSHDPSNPYPANQYGLAPNQHILAGRGSAMLAQGLMGYLPGSIDGGGNDPVNNTAIYAGDPHFGFRLRNTPFGTPLAPVGTLYGPYASDNPKNYKINVTTNPTVLYDQVFIDPYGNEILYFSSNYSIPPTLSANMRVFGPVGSSPTPFFTDTDNANQINAVGTLIARLLPSDVSPPKPSMPTTKFFQSLGVVASGANPASNNIDPTSATGANATLLLGKDSYILISPGEDNSCYTDDDLIVTKP